MIRLMFIAGLVLPITLGVVYALILVDRGGTGAYTDGDGPNYTRAADLVGDSQLIVLAEFVAEESRRVEVESPVVDHSGLFRDEIIRSFRVIETFKGDAKSGAEIKVGLTEALDDTVTKERSRTSEIPSASNGSSYVLFLRTYAPDASIWQHTGVPFQAVNNGDTLRFQATSQYESLLSERGLSYQGSSEAPFTLGLSELRQLASTAKPFFYTEAGPDAPESPNVKPTSVSSSTIPTPTAQPSGTPTRTPAQASPAGTPTQGPQ